MMALSLAVGLRAACDTSRLLDVTTPNQVPVAILDQPANANLMVNSAIGDFECALGAAVVVEGLISDELNDAQLGAAQWDYARRDGQHPHERHLRHVTGASVTQGIGIYLPLATARYDADHAITNLTGWTDAQVPNRTGLLAHADLYAGFSYALLGMSMCQAAFDHGPAVNQKGMFALAESAIHRRDRGGNHGRGGQCQVAAYVGRARVRLYQGNTAGALADAQLVPKGFVMNSSN